MEELGAKIIKEGTVNNLIHLGRTGKGVFVLSFVGHPEINPENRFNYDFTLAVHRAFDAIEEELEKDAQGAPASLLVISESDKFFSNGIDTDLIYNPPKEIDMKYFNRLAMPAFVRPLLLDIPTIGAINGHCFGAGFMFSLCLDYRLQRKERGYISANEVLIGAKTPGPELTLFRSAMRQDEFLQSMLFGKRWSGDQALQSGIVQESVSGEELLSKSMSKAIHFANIGKNRSVVKYYKRELRGYVAEEILAYCRKEKPLSKPLPPRLQKHYDEIVTQKSLAKTWGSRHRDLEYFKGIKHSML
mmetsp:Transcript_2388/g.3323  ORF Transcript_2388/g.3323 Transcript_2388/m.3323 type:complete len:302 (+) Transcript_2388:74-979(+)